MRARLTTLGFVCLAAFVSVYSKTLPLPSYITPCSRNEVDLDACALKRGREAIPKFIKGDRKYKIPVLDPLEISHIQADEGVLGLNFTASDLKMMGLRNTVLESVRWDQERKTVAYQMTIPQLDVLCQYTINGRILILPITGRGDANITYDNMKVNYTFDYDIVKKADDRSYVIPTNSKLTFDASRMYVHLTNLFNGNQLLGEQTNAFMNENWRDVLTELGPLFGDTINEVMRRIQYNIFELVDYDSAFPDTPGRTTPRGPDKTTPRTHDKTTPQTHDKTTPRGPDKTTPHTHDKTTPHTHDKTPDYHGKPLPDTPGRTTPRGPDKTTPHTHDKTTPHTHDKTTPHGPDKTTLHTHGKTPDYHSKPLPDTPDKTLPDTPDDTTTTPPDNPV